MNTYPWTALDTDIEALLDEYDRRSRERGAGATVLFADSFLALDPMHAITLTPAMLASALPARREMFDAAGVGAIRRARACQLRLDETHALVKVNWTAERSGRESLQLDSTFLVRREPEGLRIVVYLNHHDVTALLSASA
jgi:hypothetical protein